MSLNCLIEVRNCGDACLCDALNMNVWNINMTACMLMLNRIYEVLCALYMSVHGTHIVYGVECPCRGLHTLVMGLSAVAQIALHWCAVTPHYMGVCTWY